MKIIETANFDILQALKSGNVVNNPTSRSGDLEFIINDSDGEFHNFIWVETLLPISIFGCKFTPDELGTNDQKALADEPNRENDINQWATQSGGWEKALQQSPVVATFDGFNIHFLDGWHRSKLCKTQGIQQVRTVVGMLRDVYYVQVMRTPKTAQAKPQFRVERNGLEFKAFLGNKPIGQAFLATYRPGEYVLSAIDIFDHSEEGGPNYQRQGYGTLLMQYIKQFLIDMGATSLVSSNEGSGTVQLLDKTFGRKNVQHTHGGKKIDFETAKKVMDVDFGYTGSKVSLIKRPKNLGGHG